MATCNASTLLANNPFTKLDKGLLEAVKLQLLCDISASGGGGGGGGVPTTRNISTTSPLAGGGDLSADRTLSISQATGSVNGFLSSTDWTTFNGKVGGSGTTNTIPLFTASGTIGNSTMTASGTDITQAGRLRFSGTTHGGLILNNLTTAQRDAIAAPLAGSLIWNTTTSRVNTYDGAAWMSGFVRLAGDTMTGALGITHGTLTADASALNITATYNNASVTFGGAIKLNVTDTASNAASLLMDLQVAAATIFSVGKNGAFGRPAHATFLPSSSLHIDVLLAGIARSRLSAGFECNSGGSIAWSSTGNPGSADLSLFRDAGDTLAQRRTTNAQTFRLYNTFTSSTNHERLDIRWNSGVATIDTQKGSGGGTAQALVLGTDATERVRLDANGNVVVNTAAIATNATNGFLYVPSCAGTPTGTPTTFTGRVPIVVDTTNNKLYFYSSAAWRDAGP